MAQLTFQDFDLLIVRAGAGYRSQVLNSPAGQASANFDLPFSDLELENLILHVGRTRRGMRRIDSPEMQAAKDFGGKLFDAVFEGDVRACLRSSLDEANQQGVGLRLRLRLSGAPELEDIPWEFLYNPSLNRFLALSAKTPLVRYLDLPEAIRPLAVKPPLRVLVLIATPTDFEPLDVNQEMEKLSSALSELQARGLVTLTRLQEMTLGGLQEELRHGTYHVFHFIGHGGFDQQTQDGVLIFEDDQRRGRRVSGQDLGVVLQDYAPLRLAILNACEGARSSRSDPFSGVAQSLVQQSLPAVIAMQFEITDQAAITFARSFFRALADSYPVDAALSEARKTIFAAGNDIEWGTPVLYLRAPDGKIFDVAQLPPSAPAPSQAPAPVVETLMPTPAPAVVVGPTTPQAAPARPRHAAAPPITLAMARNYSWVIGGVAVLILVLGSLFASGALFPPSPLATATAVPINTLTRSATPLPSVTAIPTFTLVPQRGLLQSIPAPGLYPNSIAIDADRGKLFVCLRNKNAVALIDEKTYTTFGYIAAGVRPSHCTFYRDFVLALNANPESGANASLTVIDAAQWTPARTIDLSAYGKDPSSLAVDAVARRLYISFHDTQQLVIMDLIHLPDVKFTKTLPADRWPPIDVATAGPYSLAGQPSITRMYMSNRDRGHLIEIDTQNLDLIQPQTGNAPNVVGVPYFVAADPHFLRIYLTHSLKDPKYAEKPDQLTAYEVRMTGMKEVKTITVGDMGASGGWVTVDPRSGDVWVTADHKVFHFDQNLNQIENFDGQDGIGANPYAIAINGTLGRVYVTNGSGDSSDAINVFGAPSH